MMKYLLAVSALLSLVTVSQAAALYDEVDHNEEVNRKINLDLHSVIEVVTDIKFRSHKDSSHYYFVVPRDLEYN